MKKLINVTIIIPVYNVEKYLRKCLDSAVNQTLKEIEVIVVNDGSEDKSALIANEYSNKYPFVKVIEQENLGQGAARNKALSIAQGKYIYFLDSDDYIELQAMEELYNEAESNNLDLIIFDGDVFFEENISNKKRYKFNYIKTSEYPNVMEGKKIFARLIHNKDYSCSPCLLFIKKSVINNLTIRFFEGIIQEDELFTFELMLQCKRVKNINEIFFHRRIREGSTMTGGKYLSSFIGYSTVFHKMLEFKDKNIEKDYFINEAIYTKIGYMFGSAINRFCYMDRKDRKANTKAIKDLKKASAEFKFFGQKQYGLFYYCSGVYCLLRKFYDILKYI